MWFPSSVYFRLGHKLMPSHQGWGWGRVRNFCQELFKIKTHHWSIWPSFCQVLSKSRSLVTAALFSLAHIHLPASPSSRKICPAHTNLHRHSHPCCHPPREQHAQTPAQKWAHYSWGEVLEMLLFPSWTLTASLLPGTLIWITQTWSPNQLSQNYNGSNQVQHTWTSLVSLGI